MSGRASLDQVWAMHRMVFDAPEEYRLKMEMDLAKFISMNLILLNDGYITFAGDDREAMYAKYYARKRGVPHLIADVDPDVFFSVSVYTQLVKKSNWSALGVPAMVMTDNEVDIDVVHAIAEYLTGAPESEPVTAWDDSYLNRQLIRELFVSFFAESVEENGALYLASVLVTAPWIKRRLAFSSNSSDSNCIARLKEAVQLIGRRGEDFGISVIPDIREYPVPDCNQLAVNIEPIKSRSVRRTVAQLYCAAMTMDYIRRGDR